MVMANISTLRLTATDSNCNSFNVLEAKLDVCGPVGSRVIDVKNSNISRNIYIRSPSPALQTQPIPPASGEQNGNESGIYLKHENITLSVGSFGSY